MSCKYNVVVMGKTGVGKSSFINYLYGDKIRDSRAGRPVTSKGFEAIELKINDLPVRIFDSWGLEANKAKEWMEELNRELENRSVSADIGEWFHTVFYCISAGGARVDDFEIETINKFINNNYRVNIIFTKADQASQSEVVELEKVLEESLNLKPSFIPVCSEEKELIGGRKTDKFGREDIIEEINNGFWTSIKLRLPERCEVSLHRLIDNWCEEQVEYIEAGANFFNKGKVDDLLKSKIDQFVDDLKDELIVNTIDAEIRDILDSYNIFSKRVYVDKTLSKATPDYDQKTSLFAIRHVLGPLMVHPVLWVVSNIIGRINAKKKFLNTISLVRKKLKLLISEEIKPEINKIIEEL